MRVVRRAGRDVLGRVGEGGSSIVLVGGGGEDSSEPDEAGGEDVRGWSCQSGSSWLGAGAVSTWRPRTLPTETALRGRGVVGPGERLPSAVRATSLSRSMTEPRLLPPRPRFMPRGGRIVKTSRSSSVSLHSRTCVSSYFHFLVSARITHNRYESNGSGCSFSIPSITGSDVALLASLSARSKVDLNSNATCPQATPSAAALPNPAQTHLPPNNLPHLDLPIQRLPIIAPFAHLDLLHLLLQPLQRSPELAQIPTLLPPLLEVIRLRLPDRRRLLREQRLVLCMPTRERRDVRIESVQEGDLERPVESITLRSLVWLGLERRTGRRTRTADEDEIMYCSPDAASSCSPLSPAPLTRAHSSKAPANPVVAAVPA